MTEVGSEAQPDFDTVVFEACRAYESVPTRLSVLDAVIAHTPVDTLDAAIEDINTRYTRVYNDAEDVFGHVAAAEMRNEYWEGALFCNDHADQAALKLEKAKSKQTQARADLTLLELSTQQAVEVDKRRLRLSLAPRLAATIACALVFAGGTSKVSENMKQQLRSNMNIPYLVEGSAVGIGGLFGFMSGLAFSGRVARFLARRITDKAEEWTVT